MPVELIHDDCMNVMAKYPDKFFELAIVDPPYGIGEDGRKKVRVSRARPNSYYRRIKYPVKDWDNESPEQEYFEELNRVSRNQIIFGANHFIEKIPFNSSCWIVWDKRNGDSDFADCELAWTSFKTTVRMFSFHKYTNENAGKSLIHPTQKPIALYAWLLKNYAKPGDKILDTHGGSGSSAIAAHKLGFDITWIEIDEDYFKAAEKRFKKETAMPLFDNV